MYQFFLPPAPLQPFIQNYWRLCSPDFTLEERIVVDCHADILFNFGVAYQRRSLHLLAGDEVMSVSNLDAQRQYPVAIAQQGNIDLVAVRFKPGGLAAFMPMPMHELSNLTLDLHAAFGHDGVVLENQLFDTAENSARQIELLNHFFLRRLRTQSSHSMTRRLAQLIDESGGEIVMRDLCVEVGYSIRTVDRLFQQHYGLSPKFYARIVRVQRALSLMSQNTRLSLTEVALSCGYYDPAHFSKDFSAFAGQSPERYREFLIAKTSAPPPNLVQFLQAE